MGFLDTLIEAAFLNQKLSRVMFGFILRQCLTLAKMAWNSDFMPQPAEHCYHQNEPPCPAGWSAL